MKLQSDFDLERLRDIFRAASDRARPGGNCPDPELFWNALSQEIDGDAVANLVDHTASCPACTESWRLARECADAAGSRVETVTSIWRRAWYGWGLAAIAACLVIAIGTHQLLRTRAPAPENSAYREPAGEGPRSLLQDGAVLPRDHFALRWTSGPAGCRYNVRLIKEDLTSVWSAIEIETTSADVPPSALQQLQGGTRLFWQVEAMTPDGHRLQSTTALVLVGR